MSSEVLKNSMIISVQKEYEHNMAQQLYTSQKLWDIITLAKNDIISIISSEGNKVNSNEDATVLSDAFFTYLNKSQRSPLDVAIQAIKEEAKIILNV